MHYFISYNKNINKTSLKYIFELKTVGDMDSWYLTTGISSQYRTGWEYNRDEARQNQGTSLDVVDKKRTRKIWTLTPMEI